MGCTWSVNETNFQCNSNPFCMQKCSISSSILGTVKMVNVELYQYTLETHLSKMAEVFSIAWIRSSGSCVLPVSFSPLCFRSSDLSAKNHIKLCDNPHILNMWDPNFWNLIYESYLYDCITYTNLYCVVLYKDARSRQEQAFFISPQLHAIQFWIPDFFNI